MEKNPPRSPLVKGGSQEHDQGELEIAICVVEGWCSDGDLGSAVFGLENAIVNRGLVIDATGHVGAMLKRTAKATGGNSPYISARYLGFCSAKLSAEAIAVDPDNLAICPYVMFVYELKIPPFSLFAC